MAEAIESNWTCVRCGSGVPEEFDACWNCGADREGVDDPEFRAAIVPKAETAPVCKHCGYCLIGLNSERCPECGEEFDPAPADSAPADSPSNGPWNAPSLISGFAAIGLLLLNMLIRSFLEGARTREGQMFTAWTLTGLQFVLLITAIAAGVKGRAKAREIGVGHGFATFGMFAAIIVVVVSVVVQGLLLVWSLGH